jgi:hypothetical protein
MEERRRQPDGNYILGVLGDAIRSAGKFAGDYVRCNLERHGVSATEAAAIGLTAWSLELIANIAGGIVDFPGTISGAKADVEQSIAVGREHGFWVGAARQAGVLQGVESYYDIDLATGQNLGNQRLDRLGEGFMRFGGTAGAGAAGSKLFLRPNRIVPGAAPTRIPKATELELSGTVQDQLTDVVKRGQFKGELANPYTNSRLTIQEIMDARPPIPDPQGVLGALRWDVQGRFRGATGNWELVVDPATKKVLHFKFTTQP